MSKYERSKNTFERSEYATPVEELRSDAEKISVSKQRLSRDERSLLRYNRNLERRLLSLSDSADTNRRIKEAADDARNIIEGRADIERGRIEKGILYDSMQYDLPTNNKQDVDSVGAFDTNNFDSVDSEAAPGNSTGSAQDGLANVNIVSFDPLDDSGEFVPITETEPIRTIDWYRYDRDTNNLFFGNSVTANTRGPIKDFSIEYSGGLAFKTTDTAGGFNIQDSSGAAKIVVDFADLPTGVTAAEPAKFRSIKVCLNGVPATM